MKQAYQHGLAEQEQNLLQKTLTHLAENYRPIAYQDIISKSYKSCINQFLQDHCDSNKIVTDEQAGGKKEVWGCREQLIINKIILDQVKKNRRSLITIWLDYKKAFDSVPHDGYSLL